MAKSGRPGVALLVIAVILAGSTTADASALHGPSGEVQRPRVLVAIDAKTGKRLWRADMGDRFGLAQVQYGMRGLVYTEEVTCRDTRSRNAAFVAYDAETGNMRWRAEVSPLEVEPGPFSIGIGYAPTFGVGQSAVVVTGNDTIRGLDPRTGKQRWSVPDDGFGGIGGTSELVVLRKSGALRALDRETGETRWTSLLTRGMAIVQIAVGDAAIAFSAYNQYRPPDDTSHTLYFYDTRTGLKRWQQVRADPGSNPGSVGVVGDQVIVAADNGIITAYDAADASERWTSNVRAKYVMTASRVGPILGLDGASQLVAIEARDGSALWSYPEGFPGSSTSTSSLVLQGLGEDLVALDAHNGHAQWAARRPSGTSSVAIVGKRVIFGGGCDFIDT
jgi:outer membrane protein assembly factor BamB